MNTFIYLSAPLAFSLLSNSKYIVNIYHSFILIVFIYILIAYYNNLLYLVIIYLSAS